MSKVFRLYKEGTSTYQDWNDSHKFPYISTSRDTIEDPDGATARHEITSIPSPFARIDLVKTALKEVCKRGDLDGDTIFHKIVSDTLDVAEIFFNIDKFAGQIDIIVWDPKKMLPELDNSLEVGHKYLGDALSKYLISDGATYNFDKLSNIYLLNYHDGPNVLNIIGATSPSTLFFSNANDLSYVNNIYFGNDKPFDEIYQPLYKREFALIEYLFALKASIPNFVRLFPEVDEYLDLTFKNIQNSEMKERLRGVTPQLLEKGFSKIQVNEDTQSYNVEVLEHPLYKKVAQSIAEASEFAVRTKKAIDDMPLVLPSVSGNRYSDLMYVTDKWGKDNKAPNVDSKSLSNRVLPDDGAQYPYLTISDILESAIIKVEHKLNADSYFDGNIKWDAKPKSGTPISYLLPVKPLFFEYFTVEELMGTMSDGKPMIEILPQLMGVKVFIRIPIKGSGNVNYVEYSRLYYEDRAADEQKNEGSVVEFVFTGFVMPPLKFAHATDAIYNISCIQNSEGEIKFDFYYDGKKFLPKSCLHRDDNHTSSQKAENYLIEGNNFDFIDVYNTTKGVAGVIVPKFKTHRSGSETFEFAIDLGTSNTHIEYRKGGENVNPEEFKFSAADRQLCEIFVPIRNASGNLDDLREETELIEKDFLPEEIGVGDFRFPTRTVLSFDKMIDWAKDIEPYTLANLPFVYDKRRPMRYNDYECNIKWDASQGAKIETYVKCLLLLVRNKVLLNDGDLAKTKVTWFYPISMPPKQLSKLSTVWNDTVKRYFGQSAETKYMTESHAPIKYFFNLYTTVRDLVSIDVGGGTTDVAFAREDEIKCVTSFRFAANALFEDSLKSMNKRSGIIDTYKEHYSHLFKDNKLEELLTVLNHENNTKPANMASFLFGLKNNSILKRAGINERQYDFNYILRGDENFKIVFVIFYSSIIFHIAQIIKSAGLEVPRHISLSGNGSRVINIVTSDAKILSKYTQLIFERVLGKPYGKRLEFIGFEEEVNPKEATCKGGIIGYSSNDEAQKVVLKGDCSGFVERGTTYSKISDKEKEETINVVREFFDLVLTDINSDFSLDDNFGVNRTSVEIARREVASGDLMTFLENGIKADSQLGKSPEDPVAETLFFYPIRGLLQTIATEIYNSKNK